MNRLKSVISILLVLTMLFCAGCGTSEKAEEPTVVTLWHVYGGQTDSPLNALIEEFNDTVGLEENIRVQVTCVSNNNTMHENILSAAFKEPGAPDLPDMFVSYPKTVLAMPDDTVLVDYKDYYTQEELDAFIPAFLEEGMIDDRLLVLPVAKSTEVLYVNKTAFDRFAADTGATLSDMETWEGLFALADRYYEWTDEQTPDIAGDGKIFFVHDYHFNYFQVGTESLGEDFFDGNTVVFGDAFRTAWEPYARAALKGDVWLEGGYATEPLRTGDAIASVASSASVLYYSNTVTYSDNTSEEVEIVAVPCPVFEDGENLVMQRGAGICTVKSNSEKEKACLSFLKWLTDPVHNVKFVTDLGYMPVTQEAFDAYLPGAIKELDNPMYRSLYGAFLETQKEYTFYTPPKLGAYLDMETSFEEQVRIQLIAGRKKYMKGEGTLEDLIRETLDNFQESYPY